MHLCRTRVSPSGRSLSAYCMVFDRVAAYLSYFDRIGNRDAAVFARNV